MAPRKKPATNEKIEEKESNATSTDNTTRLCDCEAVVDANGCIQQSSLTRADLNTSKKRKHFLASHGIGGKVNYIFITPEIANNFLLLSKESFEIRDKRRVQRYQTAMESNRWHEDLTAIAFDEEGYLINGNHRMEAVVRSRVGQWFVVMTDIVMYADMDTGLERNPYDVVKIMGLGQEISRSSKVISMIRAFLRRKIMPGYKGQDVSNEEITSVFVRYNDEICDMAYLYNHRFGIAPMKAALFAAQINGVPHEEIADFFRIYVCRSAHNDLEDMIAKLYTFHHAFTNGGTSPIEHDVYNSTQYALNLFMNRTPLTGYYDKKDFVKPIWDYSLDWINYDDYGNKLQSKFI